MNREEQKKLVQELATNTAESIVKDIEAGRIPEDWDGLELRQLIADHIAWHNMGRRRRAAYANTVLVNNL